MRLRLGLLALALILLLSALFAFLPPDGLEGAAFHLDVTACGATFRAASR